MSARHSYTEAKMPKISKPILFLILVIGTVLALIPDTPAYATENGEPSEKEMEKEVTEKGDPDEFNIEEIIGEVKEDVPLGIVDDIEITGSYWTKNTVILRQLTFDIGDEISQADLDLSRRRLLQLNGLFWYTHFDVHPAEEEGHITLTLTINMRRTYFIHPAQSGASVGDRNFFTTGKGVAAGFYQVDDVTYAYLIYTDPQIFGGHQKMSFEGHLIEGDLITRTDNDYSSGEQYLYEKRGGYLRYSTKWNEDIHVGAMLRIEDVSTEVKLDRYSDLFEDDTFYLSGSWIPEGTLVTLSFSLAKGSYNSAFFPTKGYTLFLNSDHSYSFLGSDFDFSRYSLRATKYYGLDKRNKHSLAFKGEYGLAHGDIPHYELPIVDFHIRGMPGASDRGKSYIAFSGEYRFYIWPDILQGVIFVDTGRAWDDINVGFDGFATTYGIGARYQTFEHWGFNILVRADYSLGPYNQGWHFGLGHPF